jgi:hypothetical protein
VASTWFVAIPPDEADAPDAGGPPLSRALLVATEAVQVRTAAAARPPPVPLRMVERRARITDTACVLLEAVDGGVLDHAWLSALARHLDVFALALDLPGPDQDFAWTLVDAGHGVRTGTGRGADELVRICQNVTGVLGEAPAIFRWPSSPAGELLGASSRITYGPGEPSSPDRDR